MPVFEYQAPQQNNSLGVRQLARIFSLPTGEAKHFHVLVSVLNEKNNVMGGVASTLEDTLRDKGERYKDKLLNVRTARGFIEHP